MRNTKTEAQLRLKELARSLYRTGLTMREVGLELKKSRTWVWYTIKEGVHKSEVVENNG